MDLIRAQTTLRSIRGLSFGVFLGGAMFACLADAESPSFTFHESAGARGVSGYVMMNGFGGGVAACDFDDDGDVDFFLPTSAGARHLLFRNLGNGEFEEVGQALGVGIVEHARTSLWFDANGDGRQDLLIAGDCFQMPIETCAIPKLRLFEQQEDGTFNDVSDRAGLLDLPAMNPGQHRGGVCAGDVNGDGWLDLVVSAWGGDGARLLINNNGVTFEDQTAASGIVGGGIDHWQCVLVDIDNDGDLDLYSAIDYGPNNLWLNDGAGQFTDVAQSAGIDTAWNDMGIAVGDADNDGKLDFYITEINEVGRHNVLHRQVAPTPAMFEEIAHEASVAEVGFAWGCAWMDADHDGDLDLAVTNGWFNGIGFDDHSAFFLNSGKTPLSFGDVGPDVSFNDDDWGSSLSAADIDRDGDLDLLQTINRGPMRVLENVPAIEGVEGNWLVITPRMEHPNSRAIGAIVRVQIGDTTMMRPIMAGQGFLAQEPAEAHFGVGDATIVDQVEITWPTGEVTTLHAVPVNQNLRIEQGVCCNAGDLDFNGVIDARDLGSLLERWGPCDGACAGDLDFDGDVDGVDLARLLAAWG